jgi:light-regulated signal transduction histidine kinase (bacteriophytochrome)
MHAPLPTADVTACDREPIHIPGAIQPHGLLLVASPDGIVVAGAGAIEERLADVWLGEPLHRLLGTALEPMGDGASAPLPVTVAGKTERFAATIHHSGEHVLVELEPTPAEGITPAATIAWLDATVHRFERAGDLQSLFDRAVVAFRQLTGFDRVMIYRFLDDDAGRVVAEDRDPALGSFLHHHFPASDIPRQARALYVRNRARAIPTIHYTPAPLRPSSFAGLDLSDVAVRSVSPIHLQYMENMGVSASASISIVKDGMLWGLIACHHRTERLVPPDVRATAATLASGLARQIRAKEEAESYRERLRLRGVEDVVIPQLERDELIRSFPSVKVDLRQMLHADGVAMVVGDRVLADGACPATPFVAELAEWVRGRGGEPVVTHRLGSLWPNAVAERAHASGLLAVPLVDDGAVLLWFRAEQLQEVEWAGNPHKAAALKQGETLTPRASFESWTEMVRGQSRRWTLEEVEAAHRLRRHFHDATQRLHVRRLNDTLQRTLTDKDALLGQKDVLMREVNHRVQNSLQLVGAFLRLQARAAGAGPVADQLAEAQARLSAVALVHRRLYRDDQVESIDLGRYLDELVADMKESLGAEWAARIRVEAAPLLVPTDRAIDLGLILTELVINATKYAYDGAAGPLQITLDQFRNRLRLVVADDGRGKGSGEGFGSRMMNAMVQRLSGEIAFEDNAPGLRVVLTAPIEEPR